MKLASLFSGGKDSTYSINLARRQGHQVVCLLTILPKSSESHLLHHPNIHWTKLQAMAMGTPQLSLESDSNETEHETRLLESLMEEAKERYKIEGLLHGGISSNFQKEKFEKICQRQKIHCISPLWKSDPKKYMNDLVDEGFEFLITSVSSDGLDDFWLGKIITKEDLGILEKLSVKYGFNLNFEGGEAETFVTKCPLFNGEIIIESGKKKWDGYRGRFEIVEARVDYNA